MRHLKASQFETDRAYQEAKKQARKEDRQLRDERRGGKHNRWQEKE